MSKRISITGTRSGFLARLGARLHLATQYRELVAGTINLAVRADHWAAQQVDPCC